MLQFKEYPLGSAAYTIVNDHEALIQKDLRQLGVYPGQDQILMALLAVDEQPQSQLMQTLEVDHSTIAKSVARLVKTGTVSTRRSPQDGRVALVRLTASGRILAKQVREICQEAERIAAADISEDETTEFLRIARKMQANLTAALKQNK